MKREMKRVKKLVILVLNKSEKRSKKSGFCSYRCFPESEKLRCEKKNSKRAKFFVHVRHFKAVFFSFFWLRGFVMILF